MLSIPGNERHSHQSLGTAGIQIQISQPLKEIDETIGRVPGTLEWDIW